MTEYQRPTGIPRARCPLDATCKHWCARGEEFVHVNLPITQEAIRTSSAPRLVMVDPKTCRWCRKPIATRGKYCSAACRLEAKRARGREWAQKNRRQADEG